MGCVQTREYYKQGVAGLLFQISLHTRQKVSWRGGAVTSRATGDILRHRTLRSADMYVMFDLVSTFQVETTYLHIYLCLAQCDRQMRCKHTSESDNVSN